MVAERAATLPIALASQKALTVGVAETTVLGASVPIEMETLVVVMVVVIPLYSVKPSEHTTQKKKRYHLMAYRSAVVMVVRKGDVTVYQVTLSSGMTEVDEKLQLGFKSFAAAATPARTETMLSFMAE